MKGRSYPGVVPIYDRGHPTRMIRGHRISVLLELGPPSILIKSQSTVKDR